jgi:hypothetical protein
MLYGPFVHKLNKGGLDAILRDQRLLSTEARTIAGASAEVRAFKGDFETYKRKISGPNRNEADTFIEFMSSIAPRANTPPSWAHFEVQEGGFLPIKVLAVYNGLDLRIR